MKQLPCVVLMAFLISTVILAPDTAHAQYIYIDTNYDGVHTSADQMPASGSVTARIWIRTNAHRDGTPAFCGENYALTINSYAFILQVTGGTVTWGTYSNFQIGYMPTLAGTASDPTQFYVAYVGSSALSAGTYQLGTMTITVATGRPSIEFSPRTDLGSSYITAFGSACPGIDGNNTLKMGLDWDHSDGLLTEGSLMAELEANLSRGRRAFPSAEAYQVFLEGLRDGAPYGGDPAWRGAACEYLKALAAMTEVWGHIGEGWLQGAENPGFFSKGAPKPPAALRVTPRV